MTGEDGYFRLALAVIEQTVADVRNGPPYRRQAAINAIKAGGLERWLDIVCVRPHAYEYAHAQLRRLIA